MFELRNVTAGYGSTRVLRDVSIEVPRAQVVALLGANGVGKTTLLRVAARLIPLDSGSLHLDGDDVSRTAPHILMRRGVCYIPDGRGVFRSLTVAENLGLFATKDERKPAIDRAVDMFPILGQRMNQVAGTMSGGEQQMLALVRAYICGAKVVLLDEVSMGLAPRVVDVLFDALRVLAESGLSLLLVEHIDRALAMATHVYLLRRGSVVFSGVPSELDPDEVMRNYVAVDVSSMTG